MPELAEVEFYRKQWSPGLGQTIERISIQTRASVFKNCATSALARLLPGATLTDSSASAKQMLFRFGNDHWLGIHLGMTGTLSAHPAQYTPGKHDHLVFHQAKQCLVFTDPRMFGRVSFHHGPSAPSWWTSIAPAVLSAKFTCADVALFLRRHARAPIKTVLLMQECFPGIGNWMADEILWRAHIHPRQASGSLTRVEITNLHRECRWVARRALATIGETYATPPASWLFRHRWADGGICPKSKVPLLRENIGGRTACWSPGLQKLR